MHFSIVVNGENGTQPHNKKWCHNIFKTENIKEYTKESNIQIRKESTE